MNDVNTSLSFFLLISVLYFSLMIYNQFVFLPKIVIKFFFKKVSLVVVSFLIDCLIIKLSNFGMSNIEVQIMMMSWGGLGRKIVDFGRSTLLTTTGIGLGGYTGSLINARLYSFNANKEHLYGGYILI